MIAANNTAWAPLPQSRLYFYMGGTSMATPLTAGAVALLRQYFRTQQKIASPTAALLKAALIAGAVRIPSFSASAPPLDDAQGYGRVDLDAVVAPSPRTAAFVEVKPGLRTGELHSVALKVRSSTKPLRVVLAYNDYPGAALVNNLNLIVTGPDGRKHVGNSASSSSAPATLDAENNVEVVHLPSPKKGNWRIDVVGGNVPHGPQPFALVTLAVT
jgi:subtilisin family serine protease